MIKKKDEEIIVKNATTILVILLLIMTVFNSYSIHDMSNMMDNEDMSNTVNSQQSGSVSLQGIIPKGVPDDYGQELELSYDDISPTDQRKADITIRKLAEIDIQTTLKGDDLSRYINILYHMENGLSCEYCCGARSIIFETGQAACGCAHSFAMRGLTKYLILEHGDSYTDAQIFEEVSKWKVLFFPGQTGAKAQILEDQGINPTYTNIASNQFRGIEQGKSSGGGMVGGC